LDSALVTGSTVRTDPDGNACAAPCDFGPKDRGAHAQGGNAYPVERFAVMRPKVTAGGRVERLFSDI
jgi:hypothetical protein